MFRLGDRRRVRGLSVSVFGDRAEAAAAHARLDNALALIETHDPRRIRRLQRDVARILVFGHETTRLAYFDPPIRWIIVTLRYAQASTTTAEHMAGTLVHEAAHARIANAGIRYAPGIRARVEVVCAKQESSFALALPEGSELATSSQADASAWAEGGEGRWSDARFRDDTLRAARDNGMPEVLVRLLAWLTRKRAA